MRLGIGQMAHATGVSRRRLRHWEELGLVVPQEVDPVTGHRRYAPTQVGRVRAVDALRSLDFSLDDIGHLLDHDRLTADRLRSLLTDRERELVATVDQAQHRLARVRERLAALTRGHDQIMDSLRLQPLPSLELACLHARVDDESDIGEALAVLLPRVRDALAAGGHGGADDAEVVVTYDGDPEGGSHPPTILVTAGSAALLGAEPGPDWEVRHHAGCDRGVSVRFDDPPAGIGDAWIGIDARLADEGLATTGVYRQLIASDGAVTLQAPVHAAPGSAD